MNWKKYFKVKGIKPGPVHVHGIGIINLADDNLDIQTIIKIYENDFPYLEITPEGIEKVYGDKSQDQEKQPDNTHKPTAHNPLKKSIKHK